MKHTALILVAAALMPLIRANSSSAIEFAMRSAARNSACRAAPDCRAEPECCEAEACGVVNRPKPKCPCCGKKSCMVVCEMKKVKKTVWAVECGEFAPVNPSYCLFGLLGGKSDSPRSNGRCEPEGCCEEQCCAEACSDGCCKPCTPPICGKVRCRKKLIKKEVTCLVPVYKCVVTGCRAPCSVDGCEANPIQTSASGPRTEAAPVPKKPGPPKTTLRIPASDRRETR